MLPYEYDFLHAVAILSIPVAAQIGVLHHKLLELVLRHGGVPLTGITQADLLAGLLKDITDVLLVLEPTDALGADNALRPLASYELIEQT